MGAGPVIRAFAHPGRARGAVEHGDEVVIALAHEPVPALVVDIQRPRNLVERREWVRGRHAGDEVLGSALSTLVLRLPPAAGAVLERDFGLIDDVEQENPRPTARGFYSARLGN